MEIKDSAAKDKILLVDEEDNEKGFEEKLKVHKEGKLHRAFSIFVFNSKGELLLQRRAKGKYHSGGLWTNTCCSHQRQGERLEEAVHRRLKEEMGFDCDMEEAFTFSYRAEFDNGLVENEVDHVFIGRFDGEPKENPEEFDQWKWIRIDELERDVKENPDKYTYWLKECVGRVISHVRGKPAGA